MKNEKTTYVIEQKSGASIHDIASQHYDREIVFAPNCIYAVVLASYYGGKGYTTHQTDVAAVKQAKKLDGYSYTIIDTEGNRYIADTIDLQLWPEF